MTDYEALLQAVLVSPYDDLPRLVLADWLDEHDGYTECDKCDGKGCFPLPSPRFGKGVFVAPGSNSASEICKHCDGKGRIPNNNAERAAFIRAKVADGERLAIHEPGSGVDIWIKSSYGDWPQRIVIADTIHGVQLITSRGFVSGIRLSVARFMGRQCYGCNRIQNGDLTATTAGHCTCTPGLAAELFKVHPITRVEFTGAEPYSRDETSYSWFASELMNTREHPQSNLPRILFDLLEGGAMFASGRGKVYDSEPQAYSALSAAAVAYGRDKADLPAIHPLTPT